MKSGADRAGGIRAAGNRPEWEIGFAELEGDLLERNAELFRRNLRERGVSAGAEIMRCALHGRSVVRAQDHLRCRTHLVRGISRRGHAPTDEQVAIAHRARLGIPFRPTEFLSAELIRLLEMLRAEWNVLRRMIVGMVRESQRDRIYLQGNGQLIE